jgi:hypothetical protein
MHDHVVVIPTHWVGHHTSCQACGHTISFKLFGNQRGSFCLGIYLTFVDVCTYCCRSKQEEFSASELAQIVLSVITLSRGTVKELG